MVWLVRFHSNSYDFVITPASFNSALRMRHFGTSYIQRCPFSSICLNEQVDPKASNSETCLNNWRGEQLLSCNSSRSQDSKDIQLKYSFFTRVWFGALQLVPPM